MVMQLRIKDSMFFSYCLFVLIYWHRSISYVTKGAAQNPNLSKAKATLHKTVLIIHTCSLLLRTHITNVNGLKFLLIDQHRRMFHKIENVEALNSG